MPEPRTLPTLAFVELGALLVIAALPLPAAVPLALPLFAAASLSRWIRGRTWAELFHGGRSLAALGAVVGAAALALAVFAGTPLVEASSTRAVEWSTFPLARGNVQMLALSSLVVAVTAIATELALRGWLVERLLELSPGPPLLPIIAGALAESIVTPGDLAARCGAALFGAGLGCLYLATNRSLLAPLFARLTFALGALTLEALRVVG